jgi:hypothetical protein
MSSAARGSRRANPQKTEGSKALREWRGDRSQFETAIELNGERADVQFDPSRISLLENGKAEPSLLELVVLRDVAGIHVDAWTQTLDPQEQVA